MVLGDQDRNLHRGTPATYAIVPAEALVVINDEYGAVNPAYPAELQLQRPEPDGEPTQNPGNEPETEPPPAGRQPGRPRTAPHHSGETAR